jgi:hypothetical protein
MRVLSLLISLGCGAGCASAGGSPPAAQPSAPSTAASALPPSAALPPDLRGEWVEYWAVQGGADTEGYSFDGDGRFTWSAAKNAHAPNAAIHKDGNYRIESADSGLQLVLQIEREQFAPCSAPCAGSSEPREVQHATPLTEQYEIGECPSNREAERLDSSYTCRAFGGKAFWRKPTPAPSASAQRG